MNEEEKKYEEPTEPPKISEPTQEPTSTGGQVTGGLKALFIILAVLFPIIGIILGIIWLTKNTKEEKVLGKLTLTIGIIMMALSCICWFAVFGISIFRAISEEYSMLFY